MCNILIGTAINNLIKINTHLDKFWTILSKSIDKIKLDNIIRYQIYGSDLYTYPILGCALIDKKLHIGSISPGFKSHIETHLNIYPEDINHPIINHSASFKFMFGAYHPYNHGLLDYSSITVNPVKINPELDCYDLYLINKFKTDFRDYLENYVNNPIMSFLIKLDKKTEEQLVILKKIDIMSSN